MSISHVLANEEAKGIIMMISNVITQHKKQEIDTTT
jgi:hypothetical protein